MKINWIFAFVLFLKICLSFEDQTVAPDIMDSNITECGSITCYMGSKCLDGNKCQCRAGYKGTTCSEDLDECARGHGVCNFRGYCSNTIGSYICMCLPGWVDSGHCENPVSADDKNRSCVEGHFGDWCNNTCLNDSMCGPNEGCSGFQCSCKTGWFGSPPHCHDSNECTKHDMCNNSGICVNTPGSYHCDCNSGWSGTSCSDDVDECLLNTCQNNATCDNTPGSYKCSCAPGWIGVNCSYVDQCSPNPCQNSGKCNQTGASFSCACNSGWTGKICDTVDYCASSPCNNSATCQNNNTSFDCICAPGWNGTSCNLDVDECLLSQCFHSGQCINSPGSYLCNCTNGWKGQLCETDVNECDQHPCNSTLSCINTSGSFTCVLTQSGENDKGSKTNVGVVVGAVVGSLLLLASLVVAVLIARHKWIQRKVKDTTENKDTDNAPENVLQGPGNPKLKLN